MRLRQVALAAEQLEPARQTLFDLLGLSADFADPGVAEFGLVNSVMAMGDSFLEIVAPSATDTAAGRLLARRGETCGYMVLMQVDDYQAFEAQLAGQHVRKVWEVNRPEVSACHVHPKDIGGAIVSFDEMRPPADWLWGGPGWRAHKATAVSRILGCHLQSPAPGQLSSRWGEIMGVAPVIDGSEIRLSFSDGTFISFIEGADYEGIASVTFQTDDPDTLYAKAASLGLSSDTAQAAPGIGGLALHFST